MGPASDIYDAMAPLYYLSKFFGLAPFKMQQKGNKRLLPDCGLITTFRILLLWSFSIYFLVYLEITDFSDSITGVAFSVALYMAITMITIMLTSAVVNQKKIIEIINDLIDLDRNLAATNIKINYRTAKTVVLVEIIVVSVVFVATFVLQLFLKQKIKIYIYSILNVTDYMGTLFLFQYCNMLLLLRQRFRLLHKYLENLSRNKGTLMEYPPIEIKIKKAAKIHAKLDEIAKKFNHVCGLQLFSIVLVRFVMVMVQLINLYNGIKDPTWRQPLSYIIVTIYLLFHVSKITCIACLSENVAEKAKNTALYLHGISSTNIEVKIEIQLFSLQILQQDLKFTAWGFFDLDHKLLHSIAAALTTYSIIVIQFDRSECNTKSL